MNQNNLIMILILMISSLPAFGVGEIKIDQKSISDFPNYFSELAQEHSVDPLYVQHKIEQALHSILKRLKSPYVDGQDSQGNPLVKTDGFFEQLLKKAEKHHPGVEVYVSGGVVRSLLGYLYQKVHRAHVKSPLKSSAQITEAVLDRIILHSEPEQLQCKGIQCLEALGIGSDLDLLLHSPEHEVSEALQKEVVDFINSTETAANLREVQSSLKRAVVPVGDVKDYQRQMTRTTRQGGSVLDWLAFRVTQEPSLAHMKMPAGYPDIFQKFIEGEYAYLKPKEEDSATASSKQTIRGLRPLLEIPFLKLSESGKQQMIRELTSVLAQFQQGHDLSDDAYEQFKKMIRNARFEGAHNRFCPIDSQSDCEIERLVDQLSKLFQRKHASSHPERRLLIPKFIVNRDLKTREVTLDRCGFEKSGLLMNREEFIRQYTDRGQLYHGTPLVENVLLMIRNGLMLSDTDCGYGSSAYGRGCYTTRMRPEAVPYAKEEGAVLELSLKSQIFPRILDWKNVKMHAVIKALEKQTGKSDLQLFSYLVEHCDIDIIVNEHVLIQNLGVLQLPKKTEDLIQAFATQVQKIASMDLRDESLDPSILLDQVIRPLYEYRPFQKLADLMQLKLKPTPIAKNVVQTLLQNPNVRIRNETIFQLANYPKFFEELQLQEFPGWQQVIREALHLDLQSQDSVSRCQRLLVAFQWMDVNHPVLKEVQVHHAIAEILLKHPQDHTNPTLRREALEICIKLAAHLPHLYPMLLQVLEHDSDDLTRIMAARAAFKIHSQDATFHRLLVDAFLKKPTTRGGMLDSFVVLSNYGRLLTEIHPRPLIFEQMLTDLFTTQVPEGVCSALVSDQGLTKDLSTLEAERLFQILLVALDNQKKYPLRDYEECRSSIMRALGTLQASSAHLPEAQEVFFKALESDSERAVRLSAARNLVKTVRSDFDRRRLQSLLETNASLLTQERRGVLFPAESSDFILVLGDLQPTHPSIQRFLSKSLETWSKNHDRWNQNNAGQSKRLDLAQRFLKEESSQEDAEIQMAWVSALQYEPDQAVRRVMVQVLQKRIAKPLSLQMRTAIDQAIRSTQVPEARIVLREILDHLSSSPDCRTTGQEIRRDSSFR